VNHIEGHIYSAFLTDGAPSIEDSVPFLSLVVSGGHTALVRVDGLGKYTILGQTIDDASGEAFDKGAKLMGLGYPGGPVIDKAAKTGKIDHVNFPRGKQRKAIGRLGGFDPELCFSYSGLKTSLMYYLKSNPLTPELLPDVAASYQEAIVDPLIEKADKALKGMKKLSAVGGVSLNSRLRARLLELGAKRGIEVLLAKPGYCMDNAAMIAAVAAAGSGIKCGPDMAIDAEPNLEL
jgi:N6-L-threonylcarbamoyladenine synthase